MIVSAIAAMSKNRVIGNENSLPWNVPEDMKFFRAKTKNSILIMGRKTFDSLPGPLPGRFHIVISRTAKESLEQVFWVGDLSSALKKALEMTSKYQDEVFVAGGAEIYKQALPFCDKIYLSVLDFSSDFSATGDAYFPEIPEALFSKVESRAGASLDPKIDFQIWNKNS